MLSRFRDVAIAFATGAVAASLLVTLRPASGQVPAVRRPAAPAKIEFPANYKAPRTADGKPDLSGIWESLVTADVNILDHDAEAGPHADIVGAYGSIAWPGGQGIVEGGEIPYRPEALAQKKANAEKRTVINITADDHRHDTGDPEMKCYMAGVPRANYQPFPFQIIQSSNQIIMSYEFARGLRTIYMNAGDKDIPLEPPADSWMGWSHGHFDGETLVVDSTGFNPYTWLDRAGDFHSESLHVVERYTAVSPYHMMYEATIEDPKVFTRPWKMSFPLYRRMEKDVQLVDFNCTEFVLDLLYNEYYRKPGN